MDEGDRRGWHIQKGVDFAHIVTTMALIVTALWYVAGQDKRLAVLESGFVYVQQSISLDQRRTEKKFDELKVDLRMINTKLDRITENLTRSN